MNTKRTFQIIFALLLSLILFMILTVNVRAQSTDAVSDYGCNALYVSDNPDVLADYMVELIGHQPVKTTLEAFEAELPCPNLDIGRIVFNVCGIAGDEHIVCESWIDAYSHLYSDEFYYNYYAGSLNAARPNNIVMAQVQQQLPNDSQMADVEQTDGFTFNIIHMIIALISIGGIGYIYYNRSMRKSTPTILKEE